MPLNYHVVKDWPIPEQRQDYEIRDTILYNLGVGAGVIDSSDEVDLNYLWESQIKALPTLATVLAARAPPWLYDPKTSITWTNMLHGQESTVWHRPLKPAGSVISRSVVEEIYDKGEKRGALLVVRRDLRDAASDLPLATIRHSVFLRADGGFGGPAAPASAAAPRPPGRAPDLTLDLRTRPEQALIYRLSGDYYPLHVDPEFARNAGFQRPILHGLATYGIAARAVVRLLCDDDPARLIRFDARFTAPVFPGQTIRTEIWKTGQAVAHLRCRVDDRVVLDNGFVTVNDGHKT